MSWPDVLPWLTGANGAASDFTVARWLFLRALGVVYIIAFVSLWMQVKGLIGSQGILPVGEYLPAVRGSIGPERYRLLPTLFWLWSSDAALTVACSAGVLCAALLIAGVFPTLNLVLLWVLYLSLVVAGQDFLSFQWDVLLLEAGFLAIFLAPTNILPGFLRETVVPPLALFLLWWLLFRLMFESGVVKLTSGDRSWWDLTALTYHYETQPLPTWIGWHLHQMPLWFHKASTLTTYAVELGLPFLFFGPAPLRLAAAVGTVALMILISLTGNYNFFTLLTAVLCIPLIPDAMWRAVLPERFVAAIGAAPGATSALAPVPLPWAAIMIVVAVPVFLVGANQLLATLLPGPRLPLVGRLAEWMQPLRTVNGYGLFRVMTKTRTEITVEGSDDGKEWRPYEFRWKAGNPRRAPRFVQPHQPRLDWQMWFASLSDYRYEPWLQNFLVRLLQGSPQVTALLRTNPFPDRPPRFVRSRLSLYRFTGRKERREAGVWWTIEDRGLYAPVMSLR